MTSTPKKQNTFEIFAPAKAYSLGTPGDILDVETQEETISFMSSFDIERSHKGLALALELRDLLDTAITKMQQDEKEGKLQMKIEVLAPTVKKNPFL